MNKKNDKKFRKRLETNYYVMYSNSADLCVNIIENNYQVPRHYLGFLRNFENTAIKFLRKHGKI